jgi:hypothetical protein
MTTAVQNKLKGAFKIGIRTKIGYRLKAEVSFKELFFFNLKPSAYSLICLWPSASLCPLKLYFRQV